MECFYRFDRYSVGLKPSSRIKNVWKEERKLSYFETVTNGFDTFEDDFVCVPSVNKLEKAHYDLA